MKHVLASDISVKSLDTLKSILIPLNWKYIDDQCGWFFQKDIRSNASFWRSSERFVRFGSVKGSSVPHYMEGLLVMYSEDDGTGVSNYNHWSADDMYFNVVRLLTLYVSYLKEFKDDAV